MKIIIGLGNPGPTYQKTRHNFGFLATEGLRQYFIEKNYNFLDFEFNKKFNAKISQGQINDEKIFLVMPKTFMNNSGFTVQKLVQFYKLNPEKDVLIIYDDIDLPLGKIRTKGESAAGHLGMQSIIDALGTKKIPRLRLGILGKPKNKIRDTAKYVLEKCSKEELKIITKEILPKIILKVEEFLKS